MGSYVGHRALFAWDTVAADVVNPSRPFFRVNVACKIADLQLAPVI